MFSYGYLGFNFGPDGETLYYLTGGATGDDQREIRMGGARGQENLHLITYNVVSGHYKVCLLESV